MRQIAFLSTSILYNMMHCCTIYFLIGRVNHFKNHKDLSAILWLHVQHPNDTEGRVRVPLSTENSVSVEFKQSESRKIIKAPPSPELPALDAHFDILKLWERETRARRFCCILGAYLNLGRILHRLECKAPPFLHKNTNTNRCICFCICISCILHWLECGLHPICRDIFQTDLFFWDLTDIARKILVEQLIY